MKVLTGLAVFAAAETAAIVIAQVVPALPEGAGSIATVGTSIGSVGFAVWLGFYTQTKVIPGIIERFSVMQKESEAQHTVQLREQRADHLEASKLARQEFLGAIKDIRSK